MTPQTLGVMHVILNLERAGAQEVVRLLAKYQQAHGCAVTVCTFGDGPLRQDLEAMGIPVALLKRPRNDAIQLPLFLTELRRIRGQLADLIETHQIDIAQTHLLEMLDFVVLGLRASTRLRGVFWTMHNVEFLPTMPHWLLKPKRRIYRWLYRRLGQRVDGFIAVSDQVQQAIAHQLGPMPGKIHTIPNGIDVEAFEHPGQPVDLRRELHLPPDARLIVTVGRLTAQKGQRFLIEALAAVVVNHPQAHLALVGDGELRESLHDQAQQLGLAEQVHFLGVRDDVPAILATADLFVLPSLWEGLSIALLEAMAAAKPIVATEVSGTTQVMKDGETGLLVPPQDSDALVRAINQLLDHTAQAQTMGLMAREHVRRHYSASKQARKHLELYRQLTSA